MPRLVCLLLDRPPYGSLQAGEAIRHARGALGKGWDAVLALMGDAVYAALQARAPERADWPCLAEAIANFLQDGEGRAEAIVEEAALEARGLGPQHLVPGVRAVARDEIARALATCDRTLLF